MIPFPLAVLAASGASILPWVMAAISVLIGAAGIVGWLTGTVRRSVQQAQKDDLAVLDDHNKRLKAENEVLKDERKKADTALALLIEKHRGTEELHDMVLSLAELRELLVERTPRFDKLDNDHERILRAVRSLSKKVSS